MQVKPLDEEPVEHGSAGVLQEDVEHLAQIGLFEFEYLSFKYFTVLFFLFAKYRVVYAEYSASGSLLHIARVSFHVAYNSFAPSNELENLKFKIITSILHLGN